MSPFLPAVFSRRDDMPFFIDDITGYSAVVSIVYISELAIPDYYNPTGCRVFVVKPI
jgi:pimeloyl-CoA synthetase